MFEFDINIRVKMTPVKKLKGESAKPKAGKLVVEMPVDEAVNEAMNEAVNKLPATLGIVDDPLKTETSTIGLRGQNDSGYVSNGGRLHNRKLNCLDLLELLEYDRENGKVYWKPRTEATYQSFGDGKAYKNRWKVFNRKYAGKEALATVNDTGYKNGRIFHKTYHLCSVIWCMETGEWPNGKGLRFRDGNHLNTRFENLIQITDCRDYGITQTPDGRWFINLKSNSAEFPQRCFENWADAIRVRDQILGRLPVDKPSVELPAKIPNTGPLEYRDIDHLDLKQLLEYDRENGKVFWKRRTADMYQNTSRLTADEMAARFNRNRAGQEAFKSITLGKFKSGQIGKRTFHTNWVIWCLETGEWPKGKLTALDGDRLNCRFSNLALA